MMLGILTLNIKVLWLFYIKIPGFESDKSSRISFSDVLIFKVENQSLFQCFLISLVQNPWLDSLGWRFHWKKGGGGGLFSVEFANLGGGINVGRWFDNN